MRRLPWIPVVVALAGFGDDSGEAPAAQTTPEATPAETAAPAPPERARSVRDCVKLWNADGPRRIAWFVAERGYAPFSVPELR